MSWVITVEFQIRSGFVEPFMERMRMQAAESRREGGCSQFDVCVASADSQRVFLYEIYDDRRAFLTHLASEHFKTFDAATKDWTEMKTVNQWQLDAAS